MLAEYGTNLSEDKFLFMRVDMCLNIYETTLYRYAFENTAICRSTKQKHMMLG